MSAIELKVGEWYETVGGERVKMVADISLHGIKPLDEGNGCIAITSKGSVIWYFPNGSLGRGSCSALDIVKHFPSCTGWDWKEPKWRPAKAADLDGGKHVPCRVRDDNGHWTTGHKLVGYILIESFKFIVLCKDGYTSKWTFCEVRDE